MWLSDKEWQTCEEAVSRPRGRSQKARRCAPGSDVRHGWSPRPSRRNEPPWRVAHNLPRVAATAGRLNITGCALIASPRQALQIAGLGRGDIA